MSSIERSSSAPIPLAQTEDGFGKEKDVKQQQQEQNLRLLEKAKRGSAVDPAQLIEDQSVYGAPGKTIAI